MICRGAAFVDGATTYGRTAFDLRRQSSCSVANTSRGIREPSIGSEQGRT